MSPAVEAWVRWASDEEAVDNEKTKRALQPSNVPAILAGYGIAPGGWDRSWRVQDLTGPHEEQAELAANLADYDVFIGDGWNWVCLPDPALHPWRQIFIGCGPSSDGVCYFYVGAVGAHLGEKIYSPDDDIVPHDIALINGSPAAGITLIPLISNGSHWCVPCATPNYFALYDE